MGRLEDIRNRRESSADLDWLLAEYDKLADRLKRTKAISLLMLSADEDPDEAHADELLASVIEATRWIQFLEAGLQVVYAANKNDMNGRLPLYLGQSSGDKYTGEDLKIEKLQETARLLRHIDYSEGFSPVKAEDYDDIPLTRQDYDDLQQDLMNEWVEPPDGEPDIYI